MSASVKSVTTGDEPRPTEVAPTLAGPNPKVLGFTDQGALWANLGVSLLGFVGAFTVLQPPNVPQLSITAAIVATVVGTVLGSVMVGLSAIPGARTGAPAMVVLRGLFGGRLSYLPTLLNVLQLVGWGTFELIVITQGAQALFHGGPKWLYVVIAGAITTAMTLRPLGSVRVLRRYVTVAVAIAMIYLFVQILRHPLPDLTTGSWRGFWAGSDAALAVAVSWIPVASDYSRHSRSTGTAFSAATIGYSVTQILCYLIGLLALANVNGDAANSFQPFLAVPLGALFFAVLVLREVDQSFTNVYSTGVSVQNLFPRADRRVLTVGIGVLTTVLALVLNIDSYVNFLTLIGSVFVPMFGVLAADYFLAGRSKDWDVSERARSRWGMLAAWLVGLAVYQLINPGEVGAWSTFWMHVAGWLHVTAQSWMSASLFSFLAAGIVAYAADLSVNRRRRAPGGTAASTGDPRTSTHTPTA
ncbi:MAG TPA: cytosine permease [Pseudonocardiaceae bacterium]|jgi:putative hydroxymethylpyrimidine transporter CytX|nr:cytosine permease [Pseudonocardiaceae bacterium]